MKAKAVSLLVVILLITTQCMAQKEITVKAENNDISNNLDLKAVATAFGESKNLEDFERKLNDYDSGICNLDLNNDGQVDYLRVIEKNENNVHVVVIQAVLDKDVYQDVASIVVDKNEYNNNTTVQVIGDPYIYGSNYIIEPAYIYTPLIFSFFWGANYYAWHSPYYWGYYPTYYRHHSPYEVNVYLSNVYGHINHDQRYYYSNNIRNQSALNIRASISRNDYATRYPDRNFINRNENVRNKRDFEFNRNGVMRNGATRTSTNNSYDMNRATRNSDNTGNRNSQSNGWNQRSNSNYNSGRDNTNQNRTNSNESGNRTNNNWQNTNRNQNNQSTPTYTQPANNNRNSDGNNNRQNTYQQPTRTNDNSNQNNSGNRNTYQPRTNDNGNNRSNQQQVAPQRTVTPPRTVAPVVKEQRQPEPRRESSDKKDERK
jgi:hypothetical protein